jgi:YkoY family integral membrane protein
VIPHVHPADLLTVGLLVVLEGLLSADNALVMAVMVLGLPKQQRRPALSYGLVGAFVVRILATLLAVYLIRIIWVKLAGGLYLAYLAFSHFAGGGSADQRRTPPEPRPGLGLSAFWATVVRVEAINIAFSIDSILVAVAMSPKLWVVLSGGLLGIAAMRVVVTQVIRIIERYPILVDGAFVIIGWISVKLLIEYAYRMGWISWELPSAVSLGIIAAIFGATYLYARLRGVRPG